MENKIRVYNANDEFSKKIYELRLDDKVDQAIELCLNAIECEPDNNFYYKILGDMYLQLDKYDEAIDAYIFHLQHINNNYKLLKGFIKFSENLLRVAPECYKRIYSKKLNIAMTSDKFSLYVSEQLSKYLGQKINMSEATKDILDGQTQISNADRIAYIKEIEKSNSNEIIAICNYVMGRESRENTTGIDKYILSVLERREWYDKVLDLAVDLLKYNNDGVIYSTILRVCRKINNYSVADKIIEKEVELNRKTDFLIKYELSYYYFYKNDKDNLDACLKFIHNNFKNSFPINRTLYNLYLQFGKLDEAIKLQSRIDQLNKNSKNVNNKKKESIKFKVEERDSELGIINRLDELFREQDHTRKMIALKDLLKGFSHELGQPITNIRYAIQLYQMKDERKILEKKDTDDLLIKILKQTERLGKLLKRFSPIVSSKSTDEKFVIEDRINQAFSELEVHLGNIKYKVSVGTTYLYGDPVQFDQITYNLILNSVQAIKNTSIKGLINVKITKKDSYVIIEFTDNGPGVPKEYVDKIFEPFFTTKDPSKGEGGEGLGLYIVWNIVQMFNGNIVLNSSAENGTQFKIKLKYSEGDNNV